MQINNCKKWAKCISEEKNISDTVISEEKNSSLEGLIQRHENLVSWGTSNLLYKLEYTVHRSLEKYKARKVGWHSNIIGP